MIGDRHVHTRFSCDSRADVHKVINQAIECGMKDLCITDHCDIDLGEDWFLDISSYTRTWESLKDRYKNRINIHIGVEMGLNPIYKDEIDKYLASYPFELVIGSIHTMLGKDPYYRNDYDMSDDEFYRTYFETMLDCVKKCEGFNVFGHFDYVVRYGEDKAESYDPLRYAELIDEILKEIIKRDIALELNTGGLRKGIDFVHPHPYIITRYKELGGRLISVGSDAHFPCHVGAGFDEAEKVMKEFGFTENDMVSFI